MTSAWHLVRDRGLYLWVIFALPPLGLLGHAFTPTGSSLGLDPGVIITLLGTMLALILWFPHQSSRTWPPLAKAFFLTATAAWLYEVVRTQLDQSTVNPVAFCVPLILAMIWDKPPSTRDAEITGLVLAYGLAALCLAGLIGNVLGLMPAGYEATGGALSRLDFLSGIFGLSDRWSGFVGDVNSTANIAGFLVVFGATQRHCHRWILIVSGLLFLGLSQGRGGMFALVAGLLVLALWGHRVSALPRRWTIRSSVLILVSAVALAYIAFVDPTLNGRTIIWADFLALWWHHPWLGAGTSGVQEWVNGPGTLMGHPRHLGGHSVLVDSLARWGIVMALLSVSAQILVIIAGVRAHRLGNIAPLAIAIFVVVAALNDLLFYWMYWWVFLAVLVWVMMKACPAIPSHVAPLHKSQAPTS